MNTSTRAVVWSLLGGIVTGAVTPDDGFITEDSLFFFTTEDGDYLVQE
jgi:hypothetical protein